MSMNKVCPERKFPQSPDVLHWGHQVYSYDSVWQFNLLVYKHAFITELNKNAVDSYESTTYYKSVTFP